MTAAGFAGFALLLIVVSRLVPIVSIWELNEAEEGKNVVTTPIIPVVQATGNAEAPQSS